MNEFRRHSRGFTLIELMIVVTVIAILATVAYPSFVEQVRKGRRADAIAALNQIQQAQERWRANNTIYATNAQLTTASPNGLGLAATTSSGYYQLSIVGTPTGSTYTARATASGAQASDAKCATLSVTLSGGNITQASTGSASVNTCWNR